LQRIDSAHGSVFSEDYSNPLCHFLRKRPEKLNKDAATPRSFFFKDVDNEEMVRAINHVTFAVRDLERSFRFYTEIVGLRPVARWCKGAYFDAGGDWFCLNLDPETRNGPLKEYTHLAFTVDAADFDSTVARMQAAGIRSCQENRSPGKSFYFLDPDGHKLELHIANLKDRLQAITANPPKDLILFSDL
jgi:catechol 2,3-dioxygenase-like lactoylglutathione lyase family enzyme